MTMLVTAAAILLGAAAPAGSAPTRPAPVPGAETAPMLGGERDNAYRHAPNCPTPRQQIAREGDRRRDGEAHRLDREPPAALLQAVDRQVGGCRELTFFRR